MNTLKNKVNLIGNLGALPQVREVAQGRKVARMTVATHNSYRNASGERVTNTQWHTVVAWAAPPNRWNACWRRAARWPWKVDWSTALTMGRTVPSVR
jgi:single-stranded DNA-binding protein